MRGLQPLGEILAQVGPQPFGNPRGCRPGAISGSKSAATLKGESASIGAVALNPSRVNRSTRPAKYRPNAWTTVPHGSSLVTGKGSHGGRPYRCHEGIASVHHIVRRHSRPLEDAAALKSLVANSLLIRCSIASM